MKVLLTNHWLKKAGGSETYTYAMVGEMARRGYEVEVFTNVPGLVSKRIAHDYGAKIHIHPRTMGSTDIILANHNTCVRALKKAQVGPIIQTCHGTTPKLEQPEPGANYYVAISNEVARHMSSKGITPDAVIHNGINLERFKPERPLNNKPKIALSLAHSEEANHFIGKACVDFRIKLITNNKHKNPRWDIETAMNLADIVFTLGRGAYEALACGRSVAVWDKRPYQEGMGDGMITPENIDTILDTNCSGRTKRIPLTVDNVRKSIWAYQSDADINRSIAEQRFDISKAVDQYIALWLRK